ncbi:phospholipase-like protein [Tanacetum coccineum]
MDKSNDLYDVKICVRSSVKLLGEIKDLLERNPNRESIRTVNVVAIHQADHLKKKKQNSDYYPTYNLYGFAWAFKDSNPNLELYATPVEKQTGWFIASIQFIKGLVDEDFNISQDDGVGVVSGNCVDLQHNSISAVSVFSANSYEGLNETRVANNDMLLLEGGDGFFDSEGGATNPESNKDKQPTLADVLDEVRALRKEVALVNPNGNHNVVNQGLSGLANHPMSTCSHPDIDNADVASHVIGIYKADGKNDSPNGNQNGVNKGLSCSANDLLLTCSGADILDGEVSGALIGIHKADGNNDSPNVNHNAVNKGLSCSANDPMLTCSCPVMDNGEVAIAGMGIHKVDGQNDIPHANDNDVNQGIFGSANDPMLDILIQVACDGMGIDNEDGNNDYTYSQREPSTLDVLVQGFDSEKNHPGIDVIQHDTHVDCSVAKLNDHPIADIGVKAVPVDEFADDFMDVLNDEESIPNYSLDDMKLQDEKEKLISTLEPVNHQQVDELIDVHEDKTSVLQENVKDLTKRKKCGIERNYVLRSVKERKKRLAMSLDSPFSQQATTTLALPKTISRSVNGDFIAPPEFLEDVSGEPKMRSINELMTLEVFVEIMNRLPVKSLLQFRTISKSWKSCIDSSAFFFNYGVYDNLIHTPALTNLHIVNLKPIGFGVRPENLDPTIVRISYPSSVDGNWSVYVFTLSSLRWDQLDINRLPRESIRFKWSTQAVVGQFIYWVGHERFLADSGDSYKHYLLLSFDMINHRFQVIDIPELVMLVDGGSITLAPAIMTVPSHHFLKLLGFNNHDLPIVKVATGHIMAHMVQVYMGNSQSIENVAIQGNVGFWSGGLMSYVDLVKVFRHGL